MLHLETGPWNQTYISLESALQPWNQTYIWLESALQPWNQTYIWLESALQPWNQTYIWLESALQPWNQTYIWLESALQPWNQTYIWLESALQPWNQTYIWLESALQPLNQPCAPRTLEASQPSRNQILARSACCSHFIARDAPHQKPHEQTNPTPPLPHPLQQPMVSSSHQYNLFDQPTFRTVAETVSRESMDLTEGMGADFVAQNDRLEVALFGHELWLASLWPLMELVPALSSCLVCITVILEWIFRLGHSTNLTHSGFMERICKYQLLSDSVIAPYRQEPSRGDQDRQAWHLRV